MDGQIRLFLKHGSSDSAEALKRGWFFLNPLNVKKKFQWHVIKSFPSRLWPTTGRLFLMPAPFDFEVLIRLQSRDTSPSQLQVVFDKWWLKELQLMFYGWMFSFLSVKMKQDWKYRTSILYKYQINDLQMYILDLVLKVISTC